MENLFKLKIPASANRVVDFFKTHSVLTTLLIVAVLLFSIVKIQQYFDRQEVERQSKTIEKFEAEKKRSQEQTEKLLDLFEQQHTQTVNILDAIKDINGSISQMIETDRQQDDRINKLKDEYQNAKQPNLQIKQNNSASRIRANRPLRQREDDVLANDKQLYPANK